MKEFRIAILTKQNNQMTLEVSYEDLQSARQHWAKQLHEDKIISLMDGKSTTLIRPENIDNIHIREVDE